jgi:Skp family chaperone for outer membrane proteins
MKPAYVFACVGGGVAVSLLGCWGLIALLAPGPSGSVAVIDLNRVAQELGRDQQIVETIKSSDATLGQQLATYQTQLQQQFAEKKSQSETDDAANNRVELVKYERVLNQQLSKARQNAQQSLGNQRRQLVLQFREEVTPIATAVAQERGLSVVVVETEAMLSHESHVDITDAVVARLRSSVN